MNSQRKKNLSLNLVKPVSNSHLDKFKRLSKAESEFDAEILKLGNIAQFNNLGELLHIFCVLVENITSVKLVGQEKKDFVIKKLLSYHPDFNTDKDLFWINMLIDTLCVAGAISKVAKSKEVVESVKSICGGFFSK